ncbi:hypothetical protein OBBRIDRAFT_840237 [Obba rivulosa]|nr:hypothetical protein OBBRIDRAFT_840237 [Obba rivulosa]
MLRARLRRPQPVTPDRTNWALATRDESTLKHMRQRRPQPTTRGWTRRHGDKASRCFKCG